MECGADLVSEGKIPFERKEIRILTEETSKFIDNHPTLGKIPGFRSGTGWKMIAGFMVYFLLVIMAVFLILSAVINTDVATSVNTAIYTDNVVGNTINQTAGADGKFLIMNVSVKNNGNSEVTINPTEFHVMDNNESTNSQPYIGNTTIESIKLAPGENKSMVIAFTVNGNVEPSTLKYVSFWDPGSEGATAGIEKIANKTPFDGQYSTYTEKGEYSWSGGSKAVEESINTSYTIVNEPFTLESNLVNILSNESALNTSKRYNQSVKEITVVKVISPADSIIYVAEGGYLALVSGTTTVLMSPNLEDKNGVQTSSVILNRALKSIGSNATLVDSNMNTVGYEKLVRSEVIEIMGKKIDCWVTETKTNSAGADSTRTCYYDKTTGILLKAVTKQTSSGQDLNWSGEIVLNATNVPLIGVKT